MQGPLQVALFGLGTVGTGVAEIVRAHPERLARRAGGPLELAGVVVRDPDRARDVDISRQLLRTDPGPLLTSPDVAIVVEVVGCPGGSVEPARSWITQALRHGKHVVTANKDLIARHGPELLRTAAEHHGALYYEAAVAGGIPIIKSLRECLAANRVEALMGIINGTTNFMLTHLTDPDRTFREVLREAQAKGFAESDPTSDVEGYDAAYKLAILASLAFDTEVPYESVHCEGITRLTPEDMAFARDFGYAVKLLAIAKDDGDAVEARVHPTLIPLHHPLAAVHDVFNAIFVRGDAVGELMFYGQGAGRMPTASAVIADMIEAAQNIRRGVNGRLSQLPGRKRLRGIDEISSRYYVHTKVLDEPGVLARIAAAFGEQGVSIESVIQKGQGVDPVSLVFITHEVREANVRHALDQIMELSPVRELTNVIRVEGV